MANTPITGPGGNVSTVTGFYAKFTNWSMTINNPAVDITGFADNGVQANASGGPIGATGTITGVQVQGDASSTPAPATATGSSPTFSSWSGTLTLTSYTGCTYAFTAVITQVGPLTRGYSGRAEASYSFVSTGAITQTWATGS